jgi:hypothetical protein
VNVGLAWTVVVVGLTVCCAIVAWAALVYIDASNDYAMRHQRAPIRDTHRLLGKKLYDWLWRRWDKRDSSIATRYQENLIRRSRR